MRATAIWAGAFLAMGLAAAGAARADGYPPFFGYSPYLGGPTPYFTPDDTIHEVTKPAQGGEWGFGTRTYYRGGPFWGYEPTPHRHVASVPYSRRHARRVVRKD